MQNPIVNLVCSYSICTGHRLYRDDWSNEKNNEVYGKCTRDHGHEYRIEIVLRGPINQDTGMLINGFAVDEIAKSVIYENLDHRFLNRDVDFFKKNPPTAEWLSVWIYGQLKKRFIEPVQLERVRVFETRDLMAEYAE